MYAELHCPAQGSEPLTENFLGSRLRHHPQVRIRHGCRCRLRRSKRTAAQGEWSRVDADPRVRRPHLEYGADDFEVVEYLQGPRLQALTARAASGPGRGFDDSER